MRDIREATPFILTFQRNEILRKQSNDSEGSKRCIQVIITVLLKNQGGFQRIERYSLFVDLKKFSALFVFPVDTFIYMESLYFSLLKSEKSLYSILVPSIGYLVKCS